MKAIEEVKSNELQIVEFKIGDGLFGISVEKTFQILRPVAITQVPNTHHALKGIFELRGKIIPLIDLSEYLNIQRNTEGEGRIIIAEINREMIGFYVDSVTVIKKFETEDVEEPDVATGQNDVITGILKNENQMILLLDFEKIVRDIKN